MQASDREPSMEDILASIKKVIAEEKELRSTTAPVARTQEDVLPEDSESGDDVLELDEPLAPPADLGPPLLGESAAGHTREALEQLTTVASTIPAAPSINPLEEMLREMLRPVLKQWLDEHLPRIVDEHALSVKFPHGFVPRRRFDGGREVTPAQLHQAAAGHDLDDDLAALEIGILDKLDAAVETAVGDPCLRCPKAVHDVPVMYPEAEGLEACRRPAGPQEVAEPAKAALEGARDALSDYGSETERRVVEEIVAIDCGKVDPPSLSRCDDFDCSIEVEWNAERPREAVRGTERQQAEHRIAAEKMIDGLGQRPVAATHDHHRRAIDCSAHLAGHRCGIVDRSGVDQVDAGGRQLLARRVERLRAASASGVDDQDRILGQFGCHCCA